MKTVLNKDKISPAAKEKDTEILELPEKIWLSAAGMAGVAAFSFLNWSWVEKIKGTILNFNFWNPAHLGKLFGSTGGKNFYVDAAKELSAFRLNVIMVLCLLLGSFVLFAASFIKLRKRHAALAFGGFSLAAAAPVVWIISVMDAIPGVKLTPFPFLTFLFAAVSATLCFKRI